MKVDIDTSDKLYADAWLGFKGTDWKNEINVRDFIQHNYTPYEGDESFLAEATPATTELWEKVMEGIRIENATHAPVDFDTNIATTITAHDAGYINQPLEKIVGLQTDAPLKRALHPFGGINMIKSSFHAYGREMDSEFEYLFTDLRKTHNQGVFDVYSPDMLRCRKSGVSSLVWKKARIWKPPSVCVRSWQSIVMRCCRFRKWRRNMALISLARRRMRRKRCSGSTSLIWRQ